MNPLLRRGWFDRFVMVALTLLAPFLMYELNPAIRLHDFTALASDAGVTARIDLVQPRASFT